MQMSLPWGDDGEELAPQLVEFEPRPVTLAVVSPTAAPALVAAPIASSCWSGDNVEKAILADEAPRAVSNYLAAIAFIAVLLLAVLAVMYYFVQRQSVNARRRGPSRRAAHRRHEVKRITGMLWFVVAVVLFIAISSVLGLVALAVLHTVERSKLFVPTAVSRYAKVSGKFYPLPGGGGLLHCTPNADPRARPVLFAHGNTLNLDPYASALSRMATCNYNIWALEYAGYGMTEAPSDAPCGKSLIRDLREAWDICGRDDAIVVGFSMGGALLGQVYDQLCPAPAQLVFLNTFWSVPDLVASKVSVVGSLLSPLVETQWITQPPRRYCGKVVIVWSKDDDIVPPEHSAELCAIFSALKPVCIELPKGGHRWSSFCFMSSWCNESVLLPA
jgi:heme/copper-type cytochrome/quinol oxidase subunit 2